VVRKISQEAFENNIKIIDYLEEEKFENIPTKKLFSRILKEKMSGKNAGEIGLNFHYTLIKAIEKIAEKNNVKELAFSGGVWQNALLVDLAIDVLGEKFSLHFHEKLSPNDENISFGQLNYYLNLKLKISNLSQILKFYGYLRFIRKNRPHRRPRQGFLLRRSCFCDEFERYGL
jgi:hydrogenase maturation protein HypF